MGSGRGKSRRARATAARGHALGGKLSTPDRKKIFLDDLDMETVVSSIGLAGRRVDMIVEVAAGERHGGLRLHYNGGFRTSGSGYYCVGSAPLADDFSNFAIAGEQVSIVIRDASSTDEDENIGIVRKPEGLGRVGF